MSEYSEKLKKKLGKISARAKAKAAKKHAKAEKKGGKVVGTKRVTTAAEPRGLTSKRETVKVYEKEQKALDKGVRKQSKAIDKDYKKEQRKKKRRSYKGLGLAGRAANKLKSSRGSKSPRPGRAPRSSSAQKGGAAVNKMRNKGRLKASKKAGCHNKDC